MESKSARPVSPRPRPRIRKTSNQKHIQTIQKESGISARKQSPRPRIRKTSNQPSKTRKQESRISEIITNKEAVNPLVKQEFTENEPVKWNFTDPLTINKSVIKVKRNVMNDYIEYLVELKKKIEEIPKSVFTSRSKINDIIDSIDNKLKILEQIK